MSLVPRLRGKGFSQYQAQCPYQTGPLPPKSGDSLPVRRISEKLAVHFAEHHARVGCGPQKRSQALFCSAWG